MNILLLAVLIISVSFVLACCFGRFLGSGDELQILDTGDKVRIRQKLEREMGVDFVRRYYPELYR